MKNINTSILAVAGLVTGLLSCSDPELPSANLNANSFNYKATFTFANATIGKYNGTASAPSLDLYVNGVNLGTAPVGMGLPLVTSVPIVTPGATGSVTANTSIRARATSGSIGGYLDSIKGAPENKHLIYRSASNGTNNFAAVNGANYTVIAVDSIMRPQPKRLNRKNLVIDAQGNPNIVEAADASYWNPNTRTVINGSRRDSLNPAKCPACYFWDAVNLVQTTSTAVEYGNLVSLGPVPLGLTDPGGVRFYVVQDIPLTFTAGTLVTNAGIRFVNAIANSNGVTAVANANGSFGGPPIYARLNGGAPINLTNVGAPNATNSFVGGVSGGFTPSVGSRTAGNLAFTTQVIAAAGVPNAYTLQVATDGAFANIVYSAPVSFVPGKNYTVFVRGFLTSLTGVQATISHGIITH